MKNIILSVSAILMIVAIFMHVNPARAELLITPTRVLMEDKDRFAVVTLVNTSNSLKTYEMGFRYYKMREEGSMYDPSEVSVTDFDLGKYLVFTPRRISLMPRATQKIRLALRRPAEAIPAGDYRVHLEFSSVANDEKYASVAAAKTPSVKNGIPHKEGEQEISAGVQIYVGFTIPVILRVGSSDVKASIEQISLNKNEAGALEMKVPFTREGGPYSILGHLYVYHIGEDGKEEKVGEISNANIFPEVNRRVFNVVLTKNITGGKFRVVLRNSNNADSFVYDEKVFPVGG